MDTTPHSTAMLAQIVRVWHEWSAWDRLIVLNELARLIAHEERIHRETRK